MIWEGSLPGASMSWLPVMDGTGQSSVAEPLLSGLLPLLGADVPGAGGIDCVRLLKAALHPPLPIGLQLGQSMIDMTSEIDSELLQRAVFASRRHQAGPTGARLGQRAQIARYDK